MAWVALSELLGESVYLSSVDIAKCEGLQVFRLEKSLKIGKNIKETVVLG